MTEHKRANDIYNYILNNIVEPDVGNKTTFQKDLHNYGKKVLGHKFQGVFSSDKIPKLSKQQPYAILNLDGSDEPGSHWVSVAKQGKHVIVYDSFGRKTKKILPSMLKSGNGLILDTQYDSEQNIKETNCGARSLAWLMLFDKWGYKMALMI
jgi:hypothetical protein